MTQFHSFLWLSNTPYLCHVFFIHSFVSGQLELPYDPEIPLLGVYPEETMISENTGTPMSIQHYLQ